jgi:hypothetical protein
MNAFNLRLVLACHAIVVTTVMDVRAEDLCSDQYLAKAIQPEATRAQNAVGICDTARAGIKLYSKSIKLVNNCLDQPDLRTYKETLVQLLKDAESQADESCG